MKKYIFKFNYELNRMRYTCHACNFEQAVESFKYKLEEYQMHNIKNYSCVTKPVSI
jgi:hypothetical protein